MQGCGNARETRETTMTITLIEGGYLLPMTGPEHIHADGAVLIEDDRIAFAGPRTGLDIASLTIDQRIDATGRAVLPGLINTRHVST